MITIRDPKVTFVVPCFNLAHLLSECVNSILTQTFEDLEVLIMDDCSPDETPLVAKSFLDPRVQHIRNETNLGHLANYNKGIGLARGKYIWLISADDCLRKEYVLERFVKCMEDHPNVGYVFCPAMRLVDGRETEVMESTAPYGRDTILNGRELLRDELIIADCVPAPAAMVRKECYEKVSLFPPNLVYSGDWYLWCKFALYYDVGYFAEAMVNRRFHGGNISKFFYDEAYSVFLSNQLAVPWLIKEEAEAMGYDLAERCKDSIVIQYVQLIVPIETSPQLRSETENSRLSRSATLDEFDESLCQHAKNPQEEQELRSRVYASLGDRYYERSDFHQAAKYYEMAILKDPRMLSVRVKYFLLHMGIIGIGLRNSISAIRRMRLCR